MPNLANLDGLNRFKEKVQNIKDNLPFLAQMILTKVCKAGTEYAKGLYSSDNHIELKYELVSDKTAKIIASGEQIAYLEFGTGERGRGTYQGRLPDQTIEFYSNRLQQDVTLNGWVYSYAHEIDNNQSMWGGFSAQAQMWRTAQYLRQIIPQIIKEVDIK